VSTPQEAVHSAAEHDPAVLFAAGRAAASVRRVRETFPDPTVIAADQSDVPNLLAQFRTTGRDPPVTVGVEGFTAAVRTLLQRVARGRNPESARDRLGPDRGAEVLRAPDRAAARALERSVDFDVERP